MPGYGESDSDGEEAFKDSDLNMIDSMLAKLLHKPGSKETTFGESCYV